ncbi:MAG: GGDEF domain-containing protein [Lysobacterales bacterium]
MSENWKEKYFDALDDAEHAERELKRLATLLRLAVSRLSAPATGVDAQLDECLDELRAGVRTSPVSTSVESLLEDIAKIVSTLDGSFKPVDKASSAKAASSADLVTSETRFVDFLKALDQKVLNPESMQKVTARLTAPVAEADWPDVLAQIAKLVSEAADCQSRQVAELKGFLGQLTRRLKDIDQSLAGTQSSFSENLGFSEEIAQSVNTDLDLLSGEAARSKDLSDLRSLLERRTDAIQSRLHEYIDLERQRYAVQNAEVHKLRQRVMELENSSGNLKSQLDSARQEANRDALTGLVNRAGYDKAIKAEVARSSNSGQALSLIVCDIDHFKKLNDTLGHQAGDRVLASVAEVLVSTVRKTDLVARYGGEEFVVLLPAGDVTIAGRVAEKIRSEIAGANFQFKKRHVPVTLSCGFSQLSEHDTGESLFERADRLLYQAKSNGRNCVCGATIDTEPAQVLSKTG